MSQHAPQPRRLVAGSIRPSYRPHWPQSCAVRWYRSSWAPKGKPAQLTSETLGNLAVLQSEKKKKHSMNIDTGWKRAFRSVNLYDFTMSFGSKKLGNEQYNRVDCRFAPSHWEMALLCIAIFIEPVSAFSPANNPGRANENPIWWRWHGNTKSHAILPSADV